MLCINHNKQATGREMARRTADGSVLVWCRTDQSFGPSSFSQTGGWCRRQWWWAPV